jgi:hypothetical protein
MSEPDWTNEVRQEDWSLEMVFRWLEESAAFLYEIETHRRRAQPGDPERH